MNLNELQAEVEKLLLLLRDRQTGHMTWNMCLKERLEAVVQMAASAGIRAVEMNPTPNQPNDTDSRRPHDLVPPTRQA